MTQIELLVKYQEEDKKLRKIEQEINNTPERKEYIQAKNFLLKSPEKLEAFEKKAVSLKSSIEKLEKQCKEMEETLLDFDNLDELVEGGADISFYKKNVSKIGDTIRGLRSQIASLQEEAKKAHDEYTSLMKKGKQVQDKFNNELTEAYKAVVASRKEETDKIKHSQAEIAKELNPEFLNKYNTKRREKIFPVLIEVEETNGYMRCKGCGMDISLTDKEKLKAGKIIECDSCRRYLYIKAETKDDS